MKTTIKKNLNILVILLFSITILVNCQKAPINGKVDGQWQLMQFETTDGVIHPCERIYYGIQLQLVEIRDKGSSTGKSFIGRFNYDQEAGTIKVSEFRVRFHEETLATKEQLLSFGMNNTETVFDVIKADGKSLVLRSDYATLTFRSF